MGIFKPRLDKNIEDKIKTLNAKAFVTIPHTNGLPISENIFCQIYYTDTCIVIDGSGTTFNLDINKVNSIEMKTDIEIEKQYVSSIGGGIAGAIAFGPLGALIGGRIKEKKSKEIKRYLIITYTSNECIQYIGFDMTHTPKAMEFVKLFNKRNSNNTTVIDL